SQTCTIAHGDGTVGGDDVTSIAVTCTTNHYTINGAVTGLAGTGLVLQQSGANDKPLSADGAFAFTAPVASGTTYDVTVRAQPTNPSQTCVLSNASGMVGAADVTGVSVTCTTDTFSIGGNVSGLSGTGLVLQNHGGDDLPL